MVKVKMSRTVNCADIDKVYRKFPNEEIIIVIPNTKNQDSQKIKEIGLKYPNIKFSVTGGLDPAKTKFNNEHYQKRTYFSAIELSKIISIYRDIEKGIDLDWTETQKAMYVYKKLCDRMEYSENRINGRDYSRGIGGLLYNKAVCSGFAMIYKETLDRLGIECHYQNREGYHSWNIAKLDGKYRGIELTWDTSNKDENGCGFYFFNRDNEEFYSNKHHDISSETEETKFPIVPYSTDELQECLDTIFIPPIVKFEMNMEQRKVAETPTVHIDHIPAIIRKDINGNLSLRMIDKYKYIRHKAFVRNDGSHFMLIEKKTKNTKLKKFFIVEETKTGVQIGKIFSEEDLVALPKEYDKTIANGLLSRDRTKRKINDFNGYVGYVGQNHSIYYDSNIERNELNIIR